MTYENISPSEAKSRMDADPEAVIVDVRRPDEFVTGHIPGALNLPLADSQDGNSPRGLADKNAVNIFCCRTGVRSVTAAVALEKMGYTHLANFGGILDWPYEIEH